MPCSAVVAHRSWLSNIIVSAGRIIVRNVSPSDKLLFHHHYHQSVLTIIKPFLLSERVLCPRHREHLRGKQTLLHLNLPPQTQPSEFWQDCEIITITILYINISTPHIKAWHRNNKIQKILIKMVLPPSMYYTTLTFNFKDI